MDENETRNILESTDRQILLHELRRCNGESNLTHLSQRVAARRYKVPSEEISQKAIKETQTRLTQTHLIELETKNVVDFDQESKTVSLVQSEDVEQLVDIASSIED